MNKRSKILFYGIIIIIWLITLKPPSVWPIEDTVNYKLSGKVERVVGTIHSSWVNGYFIRIYNINRSVLIDDYENKKGCKFKVDDSIQTFSYIYFSNIVKKNDSIFKEKGSKIIYLYRNSKLIYKCKLR